MVASDSTRATWIAASAAFGALGRILLYLDRDFRVLHSSPVLDEMFGPGSSIGTEGRPAEELLGAELFGPAAPLREALVRGERREELAALLRAPGNGSTRPVTLAAAPIPPPEDASVPRGAFIVVLRPSRECSEAEKIRNTLEQHHWKRSRAARALGVSRTTLWRMMREAGIQG